MYFAETISNQNQKLSHLLKLLLELHLTLPLLVTGLSLLLALPLLALSDQDRPRFPARG
jgi:hypothetical protein